MNHSAILPDELGRLRERVKKLAQEKSWLQFTITLMMKLSTTPGLSDTVENLLRSLVDFLGGTNAGLYYFVGADIRYADVLGVRKQLPQIDDPLARQAVERREFAELVHDFADTRMLTAPYTEAWTCAFPLLVGQELVGVCKLTDMHLTIRELLPNLPPLFNYIALILKNEIQGYSRLRQAYDQLEAVNEAILREQTFTQAVLENIEDGVIACDENGVLSLSNRAARRLYDLKEERLPPERWVERNDLYLGDGETPMPNEASPLFRAFQGEHVRNAELVIAPNHGRRRLLLASGQAIFDSAGHKRGAVVILHDITEQRQFEQTLARAKEEAEAANRAKSVFLANMSHELRTPMNAILGFAQLMQRDSGLNEDQREHVATIQRSGEHLLALINDVLEISKIEAGRTTVEATVFDLHEMLVVLEEMTRIRAGKKGIEFNVTCAPDLPAYVVGDERKLRQILLNLLSNAIKFTDRGEVAMRVEFCPREAEIANCVAISVADSGCGIPAGDLERVFEAFFQTEASARRGEGTGLGLSISREYVRLMGGTIEVDSEEGKGSTFRVRIPLPAAPEEAVARQVDQRQVVAVVPGAKRFRILVAEDKDDNRRLLVNLLQSVGFEVRAARDGAEALKIFHAWRPHFIWMDMRMPIMDGYEATRRIKATPHGHDTVVVALTASAFEEDRAAVMSAGCDDFLRKPVAARALYDMLHKHLGVEYEYAEEGSTTPGQSRPQALPKERLKDLPETLRNELREVALSLDTRRTREVIGRIQQVDAELATQLRRLADGYRFDEIQRLFES